MKNYLESRSQSQAFGQFTHHGAALHDTGGANNLGCDPQKFTCDIVGNPVGPGELLRIKGVTTPQGTTSIQAGELCKDLNLPIDSCIPAFATKMNLGPNLGGKWYPFVPNDSQWLDGNFNTTGELELLFPINMRTQNGQPNLTVTLDSPYRTTTGAPEINFFTLVNTINNDSFAQHQFTLADIKIAGPAVPILSGLLLVTYGTHWFFERANQHVDRAVAKVAAARIEAGERIASAKNFKFKLPFSKE